MFNKSWLVLLFWLLASSAARAYELTAAQKITWDRYLQFESKRPYKSSIQNRLFFLHSEGQVDSQKEWLASLEAIRLNKRIRIGNEEVSFDCAFPARLRRMGEFDKSIALPVPCAALQKWRKAFAGRSTYVDYAGAYTNNPASLFGHTFFRFSRQEAEEDANQLRSQVVSYLADVQAGDGELTTIAKGLFGFYQGKYNVEPFYINAAMYNNAEARNLWEFALNLSVTERDFLVDYLWELSHFASSQYWFLSQNCSHQLLTVLEAVRPSARLTAEEKTIVLPLDTISILEANGLLSKIEPRFEPSIQKRIDNRIARMSQKQREWLAQIRRGNFDLNKINDSTILDTLIEEKTHEIYKLNGQLSPLQTAEYHAILEQRAKLGGVSAREDVSSPPSPLSRHRTALTQLGANSKTVYFRSLLGAHSIDADNYGLEEDSTIEYGGLEFFNDTFKNSQIDINFLIGRVRALNSFSPERQKWSWYADGFVTKNQFWALRSSGGGGLTLSNLQRSWLVSVMAIVEARLRESINNSDFVGGGPLTILKVNLKKYLVFAEFKHLFFKRDQRIEQRAGVEWFLGTNKNTSIGINYISDREYGSDNRRDLLLSGRHHF